MRRGDTAENGVSSDTSCWMAPALVPPFDLLGYSMYAGAAVAARDSGPDHEMLDRERCAFEVTVNLPVQTKEITPNLVET